IQNLRQAILDEMITDQLLYQEAQRLRITPPKEAMDGLLAQFKAQFKDEAEMQKDLQRQGKTLADLRALIVRKLVVDELTEQWLGDIVVTDADISKYYRDNQKRFHVPEGSRVRHILVVVRPGATAADKKKAQERAQNLLKQVQAKNVDFAKIASINSDDPASRGQGGNLGVLLPSDPLLEPLKKAVFTATVGKPVLVESDFGYHIIKVEAKVPAHTLTLAEVKKNPNFTILQANLLRQKRDARYDEKIEALRARAKIKKYI
ncbi:MAG TPA: peptidylprolyl isomerase, partial [Abditibacteriaceae bacterium]|nr:peptidylprolyl isomerase [Abditibacteriaceae bacterium]